MALRDTSSIACSLTIAILAAGCPPAEPRATQPVSVAEPAGVTEPEDAAAPTTTAPADLRIALAASRTSAGPGQEIELRVTYRNAGNAAFRVLEDTTFVGSEFVVQPAGGEPVRYEGGYETFSPKQGLFLGRTFLLEPGAEYTVVLPVWIDAQYRLLFTNNAEAELGIGPSELKTRLGAPPELPRKYLSAGRIFPVGQAGPVSLRFRYECDESDRSWRINSPNAEDSSLDDLWMGRAESNTVELVLE